MKENNTYGFILDKEEKVVSSKRINLNLSLDAIRILKEDINSFDSELGKSTIINRIVLSIYPKAHSSIISYIDEYKNKLQLNEKIKQLNNLDRDKIINIFADIEQDKINKEICAYINKKEIKGEDIDNIFKKPLLNKEVCQMLSKSKESQYYGENDCSTYIKCLVEEYCSKPKIDREKIFLNHIIGDSQYGYVEDRQDTINYAIKEKKWLKIVRKPLKHQNVSNQFFFFPLFIRSSKNTDSNYLLGYYLEFKDVTKELQISSPRCVKLTNIESVVLQSSYNGIRLRLPYRSEKEAFKEIEERVKKYGPEYISGEIINVTVKFTDLGLDNLKRIIRMRPLTYYKDEKDDHIYHFESSSFQIEKYLERFGKEAIVVIDSEESEKLKENLKEFYENAYNAYKDKEQCN